MRRPDRRQEVGRRRHPGRDSGQRDRRAIDRANPRGTGHAPEPTVQANGVRRHEQVRLSERVTLEAGDRIRVRGGPYWQQTCADGTVVKTRMAERGVMVFDSYCEYGDSRWIVARGSSGYASLHIGEEHPSEDIPGYVRRPYRVTKVRRRSSKRDRTAR